MTARFHPLLLLAFFGIVSVSAQEATTDTPAVKKPSVATAAIRGFTYTPPKEEPTPPPEEEKPRNEIIRLPNKVVLGARPPVFNDRALHSRQEMARLAKSKFLSEFDRKGLNAVTLPWLSNEKRAMEAFYDDERQRNVKDLKDAAEIYKASGQEDKAAATENDADTLGYRPSTGGVTRDKGTWFGEQK